MAAANRRLLKVLAGIETCQGKMIRTNGMKTHMLAKVLSLNRKPWQEMQAQNRALKDPEKSMNSKPF
ncbi:hypothetical protein [Allobaculum sp. JKK-2023]|uniref:hypothetical protein n=1 Tax=Allobaculum sp. JKK-2023 TaxID=3108943 RepID=UPI002B056F6D|nr:hypothetical protein [Allobaculum sp. JKK-2023]